MEPNSRIAGFPGLAALGLCPRAWEALSAQGTVCPETNKAGTIYKLRYRVGGRQQSRYLGRGTEFVEQVRRELAELQAATRRHGRLRRLVREARQCVRKTKRQLQPFLPITGRTFHGREIRRQRQIEQRTRTLVE